MNVRRPDVIDALTCLLIGLVILIMCSPALLAVLLHRASP